MAKPESLTLFIEQLDGWMNPDGDKDYCPVCWEKFIASFDNREREILLHDTREYQVTRFARSKRSLDGWFVLCEGFRNEPCPDKAEVFVPYGTRHE